MKVALPDSGSNAATALAAMVAEMLGFTTCEQIRLVWGDSDLAPLSDEWFGGRTITLQGAAVCFATDKLRKDLLERAADFLRPMPPSLRCATGSFPGAKIPRRARRSPPAKINNAYPANSRHHGAKNRCKQRARWLRRSGSRYLDWQLAFVRSFYTHILDW